jgi:hypothetical protein
LFIICSSLLKKSPPLQSAEKGPFHMPRKVCFFKSV